MASTICAIPEGYPAEIIGYADPWIVSPGDEVEIKVGYHLPSGRAFLSPVPLTDHMPGLFYGCRLLPSDRAAYSGAG